MAFTVAQLTAIETAIASGELIVEYDGKKIEYRNMNSLLRARDVIRQELIKDGLLDAPTRGWTTLAEFRR